MLRRSALPGPDTCKQQDKRISLVQDYCIPKRSKKCPKRREKALKSSEIHLEKILQSQLPLPFFHCRPEGPGPEGTLEAGRGASMTLSSHAESMSFRRMENASTVLLGQLWSLGLPQEKGQRFHRASRRVMQIANLGN